MYSFSSQDLTGTMFPLSVGPTVSQFGCWSVSKNPRHYRWTTHYRAQPSAQSSHRFDYLLKVVRSDLSSAQREVALERFTQRVVANECIHHHGLAPVLDAELDRTPFYVVEPLIAGKSMSALDSALKSVSVSKSIWLARQLADVVAATHAAQRVHLSIQPESVLVDSFGKVILMGWGGSQAFESIPAWNNKPTITDVQTRAPETYTRDYVAQPSADVYSMGTLWYWLFSGKWPFVGESTESLADQHRKSTAPRLDDSLAIPVELKDLIAGMLSKNPLRRPNIHHVLQVMFSVEIDHLHDGRLVRR
ncbi:MAG: protein kinase [Pirellulaceae bacterium]